VRDQQENQLFTRFGDFINEGASAFHVTRQAAALLSEAGWEELKEEDAWQLAPGRGYFVIREGSSVAAFRVGTLSGEEQEFRISGAHTDSPALKIKWEAVTDSHGYALLPVEVYGGPILSTWIDRDLGMAGRLVCRGSQGLHYRLVKTDAVASIPNLAIHLNRKVNEGFEYNKQDHLPAILGRSSSSHSARESFLEILADAAGVTPDQIVRGDLFLYDPAPLQELSGGIYSSGRIDNIAGCFAGLAPLLDGSGGAATAIAFLYDNEEVGSRTRAGANSSFLPNLLERIVLSRGGSSEAVHRARARSMIVSNDAAHGIHPAYADKHDSAFAPLLGGGPVIKFNGSFRYTSTAASASVFEELAATVSVPLQYFANRSDMPSGSTIGPFSSAHSGIPSVDVGVPILAMHSIRESGGRSDLAAMVDVLNAFYQADSLPHPA